MKTIAKFPFAVHAMILLMISITSCDNDEPTPETIVDVDGNVYTSIQIGTQVWMVENLKVTHYRNGDPIPDQTNDQVDWSTLTTGAYSDYHDDLVDLERYGKLYNWHAVNDSRKIAPEGWHVPSDAEWSTLITYLGGENLSGGKLKKTGTDYWCDPNTGATNESGFEALPGEWRLAIGFATGCNTGGWWSSTEKDLAEAYNLFVFNNTIEVSRVSNNKYLGLSVRCVKD